MKEKKEKKEKKYNKDLLIINLHLWPDRSSCSAIIYHIANSFTDDFENVYVIASKPKRFNSKFTKFELKKIDNETDLQISRLHLFKEDFNPIPRILNALLLGIFSSIKIIFGKYKVVIATSSPPILTAFIIAIACKIRRIRFIYYCMDINPEIGILSGDFRNKILKNFLLGIDKFTCKEAKPVIVHSESMQKTLQERFSNKVLDIEIINSLSVPSKVKKEIKDISHNKRKGLKIIYAGNIGRFQDLKNIIFTFKYLKKYKDIELNFLGDGVEKFRLEKLSKKLETNINFINYVSYEDSKNIIETADLGLVSLMPNMYKYAYPSKTMVYLEKGIPILALIEKESDLAKKITQKKIGFVHTQNNHKSLAEFLIKLYKESEWKKNFKKACLETFKSDFSNEVILGKWKKIVN